MLGWRSTRTGAMSAKTGLARLTSYMREESIPKFRIQAVDHGALRISVLENRSIVQSTALFDFYPFEFNVLTVSVVGRLANAWSAMRLNRGQDDVFI